MSLAAALAAAALFLLQVSSGLGVEDPNSNSRKVYMKRTVEVSLVDSTMPMDRDEHVLSFTGNLSDYRFVQLECAEKGDQGMVTSSGVGILERGETLTYKYVPTSNTFNGSIRCIFELYDFLPNRHIKYKEFAVWFDTLVDASICHHLKGYTCVNCEWLIIDDWFYISQFTHKKEACHDWEVELDPAIDAGEVEDQV